MSWIDQYLQLGRKAPRAPPEVLRSRLVISRSLHLDQLSMWSWHRSHSNPTSLQAKVTGGGISCDCIRRINSYAAQYGAQRKRWIGIDDRRRNRNYLRRDRSASRAASSRQWAGFASPIRPRHPRGGVLPSSTRSKREPSTTPAYRLPRRTTGPRCRTASTATSRAASDAGHQHGLVRHLQAALLLPRHQRSDAEFWTQRQAARRCNEGQRLAARVLGRSLRLERAHVGRAGHRPYRVRGIRPSACAVASIPRYFKGLAMVGSAPLIST